MAHGGLFQNLQFWWYRCSHWHTQYSLAVTRTVDYKVPWICWPNIYVIVKIGIKEDISNYGQLSDMTIKICYEFGSLYLFYKKNSKVLNNLFVRYELTNHWNDCVLLFRENLNDGLSLFYSLQIQVFIDLSSFFVKVAAQRLVFLKCVKSITFKSRCNISCEWR